MDPQAGVAEYILAHKPSSVVVETALDFQHGTATGNAVRIDDATTDFSIGMFQQLGRQLSWEFNPMSTDLWQVVFTFLPSVLTVHAFFWQSFSSTIQKNRTVVAFSAALALPIWPLDIITAFSFNRATATSARITASSKNSMATSLVQTHVQTSNQIWPMPYCKEAFKFGLFLDGKVDFNTHNESACKIKLRNIIMMQCRA